MEGNTIMKKSFTLVELLVVIAIIALLAGLLLPVVNGAMKKGRVTQAKADINNIITAVKAYESTYRSLPFVGSPRKLSSSDLEDGFAKEDKYTYWHDYRASDGAVTKGTDDSKAYDTFVQYMSKVDITNEDVTEVKERAEGSNAVRANVRNLRLLEVPQDFQNRGLVDPWGTRYAVIINDGYAKNGVTLDQDKNGKKNLLGNVFVYSFGPNLTDNYGITETEVTGADYGDTTPDDINSWTR